MDKKARLLTFLSTLYVPKGLTDDYSKCCDFIRSHDLRDVERYDEHKIGIDIISIKTSGKGKWASYAGFAILKSDFNRIGDKYAEAYVYQPGYHGFPQRVYREGSTFAIVNDLIK